MAKEVEIIRGATPNPAEILTTFLDEDGFPRNVLLRAEDTAAIDPEDDDAVAQQALKCYVGKEEVDKGEKEIPEFSVKPRPKAKP